MKKIILLVAISLSILFSSCDSYSEMPQPMTWTVSASGDGVSVRYDPDEYPQIHISADYNAGEAKLVCTSCQSIHFGYFNNSQSTSYDFEFGVATIVGNTVIVRFNEDTSGGEARNCVILVSSEDDAHTGVAITRTMTEMRTQFTNGM